MNKGKIAVIPIFILSILVMAIGSLVFILSFKEKTKSIFNYETVEVIEKDGHRRALDGSFKLTGIDEFGFSGDGQIDVDEKIQSIWFITNLSTEKVLDEGETSVIVEKFIKSYSGKLRFPIIEEPVKIPYCDEETLKSRPEDDYKALAEGYILFEYSYRDLDGTLWIAQIFSPQENILKGLLVKQIDETEFEGYIPQMDIREEH